MIYHLDPPPPDEVISGYVGSPLYEVIPEHGLAVVAALLVPVVAWWLRRRARRGSPGAARVLAGYRALDPVQRLVAWLLAIDTAIHLGLLLGHEPSGFSILYGVAAAALGRATWLLLSGRRWRRWTGLVLAGSMLGYVVTLFAGEPPDQLGMISKLIELTVFAAAVAPVGRRRLRRIAASSTTLALLLVVAVGGWAGAFASGDGGHHLGEVPPPGVLLPAGEDREPTIAEQAAADAFLLATAATLDRYQDPAVAAADGYQVEGMFGTDFHAANPTYQQDGRIFDPARPETLVYAVAPSGDPVLLGALYEMPERGVPGPAIGGPLTVWHAHDHVCFSLIPPALAGLVDPFGMCPVGSIAVPITPEMIHVWTVPGAPEAFGDLDDAWLAEYLAGR